VTIRKFPKYRITVEDYIKFGTATAEMMEFLRACVEARLNMYISGGTGSGKTTLLNILSGFIPEDERIITIEDAAELKLVQDHVHHRGPGYGGRDDRPSRRVRLRADGLRRRKGPGQAPADWHPSQVLGEVRSGRHQAPTERLRRHVRRPSLIGLQYIIPATAF